MNTLLVTVPFVSAVLPKMRWAVVLVLLGLSLLAPQLAQACSINSGGGCGG